jgi:glycine cleavage system H lipoate-binding protein
MRCPFLREEQVRSCQASPIRKPIARSASRGEDERCSSPAYASCPTANASPGLLQGSSRCPFLLESLAQHCAASPLPTYVPWTESPASLCSGDGHRFCETYLSESGPRGRAPTRSPAGEIDSATHLVDGIPMPGWLSYAPNHMWLEVCDDGLLYAGVDAFLTQLVGTVERIAFLTLKGAVNPAVVLTVCGVDLTLHFPHRVELVTANTHLRSNPGRLVADPYGLGWLFEARAVPDRGARRGAPSDRLSHGMLRGLAAREHMSREVRRLSELIHDRILTDRSAQGPIAADGGRPAPDLLLNLGREEILRLFAELFPIPGASGRRA